jgi:hypothetical protein
MRETVSLTGLRRRIRKSVRPVASFGRTAARRERAARTGLTGDRRVVHGIRGDVVGLVAPETAVPGGRGVAGRSVAIDGGIGGNFATVVGKVRRAPEHCKTGLA